MTTNRAFEGHNAVVFAATGAIASATAMELARQGASLFLSARNPTQLRRVREMISLATGTTAESAVVNAEDQDEVAFYFQSLVDRNISPDLVFNGIGVDPVESMYGRPSDEVTLGRFLEPITRIVGSQFITATLGAGQMRDFKRGTILLLTSSLSRSSFPNMAGITAASDAVQGLARVLASEFNSFGIRVACVRVDAIPETRTIQLTTAANAKTRGISIDEYISSTMRNESKSAPFTLELAARGIVHIAADAFELPSDGQPIDVSSTYETERIA